MNRILKLAASALVALAVLTPAANAKPVSRATARQAIERDRWYDSGPNLVLWCKPENDGTLCRVATDPVCYNDHVFGVSEAVDTVDWWVSRTHGVLSDEPVGDNTVSIWGIPPGETCKPGEVPH